MKSDQEPKDKKEEPCQFCQTVERVEKIVGKYKLNKRDTKTLFGLLDNWDAANQDAIYFEDKFHGTLPGNN